MVGSRVRLVTILVICIIGAAYAITRLTNLTAIPLFTDEAIYIRWSQIGAGDANWRFISLVDGKQPFFTWVVMVLLRLIPGDPLFIGRLASVLAGIGSIVGIWFLSYELFGRKAIAFMSSILYLVSPFALVYDRMALYDSMVATFFIWNFYLAILLARRVKLDVALILGMMLGVGMLNKTSGFLSLYLLPMTLIVFDWQSDFRWKRFVQWVFLVAVATIISQLLYSVLRLSPLFSMVSQKDSVFVYSYGEWIKNPFLSLEGNLRGLLDWLIHYLTWPVFFAALLPAMVVPRSRREYLLIYAWWVIPFVGLASFGRVLYPRFILPMSMPLLVVAATTVVWVLEAIRLKVWKIVLAGIFFLPSLLAVYYLLFNPLYAPIPYADRGQYISDWPAGWGVREVNNFLGRQAARGHITVFTEGTFGLLPYAIEIYLVDNPNVTIRGIWPVPQEVPDYVISSVRLEPTYLVFSQQDVPKGWPVSLVAQYQKGLRTDRFYRLYKVSLPVESL